MSSLSGIWVAPGPCRRSGPPSRKPDWSALYLSATSPSTTWGPSTRCRARTGAEPPSTASSTPSGESLWPCVKESLTQFDFTPSSDKCELIMTCAMGCQGRTLHHFGNMSDTQIFIKSWVSQSRWYDGSNYVLHGIRYFLYNYKFNKTDSDELF